MKKVLYITFLIFISFSFKNVLAIDACTSQEMSRLKELAGNVKFRATHEIAAIDEEFKEIDAVYTISVLNSNEDLKIYYKGYLEDNDEEGLIEINDKENGFAEGSKVKIYIYSHTINMCTDTLLKTVTVNLPKYNDYYYFNKDKCDANPDFKYCKEFMDVSDLDFSEIDKMYEDSLKGNGVSNIIKNKDIPWYFIAIGAGALALVIVTVVVIVIKKRNQRDEL